MHFRLDDEQRQFAAALDGMLTAAGTPAVVRAWAAGDPAPGRALWTRLAEAGVFGLAVPERHGGFGPLPAELVVAFVALGRHAVPGPLVETVATAALLDRLGAADEHAEAPGVWLPGIASGKTAATLCRTADSPYALDADTADAVFVLDDDALHRAESAGPVQPSADPARRLARPGPGAVLAQGPAVVSAAGHAARTAALATAAQALGLGRALLEATVAHARQRTQFGVAIGSFQAVKHRLADTLVALEFTEPLLYAAALALPGDPAEAERAVAAAKVSACEAACTAARAALRIHGAVGYTEELDLSLWIRKARCLRTAWGTPADCRARVLTPAPAPSERSAAR